MKKGRIALSIMAVFIVAIAVFGGVSAFAENGKNSARLLENKIDESLVVTTEPEFNPEAEKDEPKAKPEEVKADAEENIEDQADDAQEAEEAGTEDIEFDEATEEMYEEYIPDGRVLDSYNGTVNGPSGIETFYNLPMGGVIENMREMGYSEEEYPYWERDDGAKMFGGYIMVAANTDHLELGSHRPYGTILETSLGTAIVCDTGSFVWENPGQVDVAVTWVV